MTPTLQTYDLVIVGAGPVGCVIAERAARLKGWSSLIVEKRNHIAGNCYDSRHTSGVMIHNYGPHYFRTNKKEIVDYLSAFTDWIEGDYKVKSCVNGKHYPFPINLDTLEQFFETSTLNPESAQALLERERIAYPNPANSEQFVLNKVGQRLFDAFYKNYTLKQWEKEAKDLAPSVCGRIPIKLNRDPYYVDHKYKLMPKSGYTAMFKAMIDHKLIDVQLETDYFEIQEKVNANIATIYSGPIDRYFNFKFGKLEWRSLRFEWEEHEVDLKQECCQINFPNDHAYTRSVEIKHVTKQQIDKTVISKEFPVWDGDPFYPVPDPANQDVYAKYRDLADSELDTYFVGRLAEYTYINTDEAIERALSVFEQLDKNLSDN